MKLTEELRTILLYSRDEAMRTGCYAIAPEHLMLGILRHGSNGAVEALKRFGVDTSEVKRELDGRVFHARSIPFVEEEEVNFTRASLNVTNLSIIEAMRYGQDVSAIHMLAALCDSHGEWCCEYLRSHGLSLQILRTFIEKSSADSTKKSALPNSEDINRLLGVFYKDKEFFS